MYTAPKKFKLCILQALILLESQIAIESTTFPIYVLQLIEARNIESADEDGM